jgi:hypothetical protein
MAKQKKDIRAIAYKSYNSKAYNSLRCRLLQGDIMRAPDFEYQECPEHGEYPADYLFCPGCEAIDRDIDEAIEREHLNEYAG